MISRTASPELFNIFHLHHSPYSLEKFLIHRVIACSKLADLSMICIYRCLIFSINSTESFSTIQGMMMLALLKLK
jgi:hypothetical protein